VGFQLDFPGVQITDIGVQTPNQPANLISTFWTKSDVDLSRGLDFTPRGPVLARFTHLNHTDFTYRIIANNRNNASRQGTVRIFIAPRQDERGLPYVFRDQKELMIEMDKFTVSRKSSIVLISSLSFLFLDLIVPGVTYLKQYLFCYVNSDGNINDVWNIVIYFLTVEKNCINFCHQFNFTPTYNFRNTNVFFFLKNNQR